MRNAGTQLRPMSAALIPPKGIVFGAIDPAMHADGDKSHKKKPSIMPGRVRATFYQLRVLPLGVVKKKYPKRRKASISPHRQPPRLRRQCPACRSRRAGAFPSRFRRAAVARSGQARQCGLPEAARQGGESGRIRQGPDVTEGSQTVSAGLSGKKQALLMESCSRSSCRKPSAPATALP